MTGKYKIVVVGPQNAGKTSLVKKLLYNNMEYADGLQTLPVRMFTWNSNNGTDKTTLQIWEWVGETKHFAQLAQPSFLKNTDGAILAYDCSQEASKSLAEAMEIYKTLESLKTLRCLAFLGCKADIEADKETERLAQEAFHSKLEIRFGEHAFITTVSAKTGTNVKEVFTRMASCLQFQDSTLP